MRPELTLAPFDSVRNHSSSPLSASKIGRFAVIDDEIKSPINAQSSIDDSMSFLCKPRLTLHINPSPVHSPRSFLYQTHQQHDFSSTAPITGWLTPHDHQSNGSSRKSSVAGSPRRFSYPPISTSQTNHQSSFSRISALTPVSQSSFFSQLEKRRAYQPRRGIDLTLETGKWFRTKFSVNMENSPSDAAYQIHVVELDALNGTSHTIGTVNPGASDAEDHDLVAWQCQTSDCHLLLRLVDQSNQAVMGVATVQVRWLIESHSSHTVRFHHPSDQSINETLDKCKTSASFQLNHLTCYQSVHSLADYVHESAHVKAAVMSNSQSSQQSGFLSNLLSPSPVVRSITA